MCVTRPRGSIFQGLLAFILLLTGCAKVGPDYVRPEVTVSSNWLEVEDRRIKTEPTEYRSWWETFNDPVLNRIIDRAYHENLSLKIAGVRVLAARAQLGITVGNLYPQTQQASGSVIFNRASERSATAGIGKAVGQQGTGIQFSTWQDQVGLNAAWEIDFWGKFRRAVESADAGLLSSLADYDSALVSLTADAASAYVQIRTLQKRLDIARQNIETQKESLQIAEVKYKGGLTTERDVEQAKTVLFNTQSTVPTLELQLRQEKNALSVLLGLPPGNLEDLLLGASDIPAPPPQVAVGIPADLLRRRPDVRSAELQAAAQCAQIGVAKAELFPAFSLTGTFGFLSTDVSTFKLSDMADWRSRVSSVGPSVQWNILNYGRITNKVRLQDARFQELLVGYQNTVLQAQREVENSLAGFLRTQENAEFLAQTASAAKRSLDLAALQYRAGSADFTTVLAAQQSLLTAQDSFASAMGSISVNLVGLYRALGGGWQIREGQDVVSPEVRELMAKRTNWGNLLSPSVYLPPSGPEPTLQRPDW
jgi:NodT family efflux transporter outer membrane factor (OMF) lipoprotein